MASDRFFRSILWDNLNKTFAGLGAIITFIITPISFYLAGSFTIQWGWIVLVLSVFIIFFASLIQSLSTLYSKYDRESSAKIFNVIDMQGAARDHRAKAICLIKPSNLFQKGNLVSFYYNYHEDLEYIIGFGLVTNVAEKVTQIELSYPSDTHKDIVDKLVDKNKDVLEKMKIKPSIPEKDLYELISKESPGNV